MELEKKQSTREQVVVLQVTLLEQVRHSTWSNHPESKLGRFPSVTHERPHQQALR
jgi:hypothetical protein